MYLCGRKSSVFIWNMQTIAQFITKIIDFFYQPFRRLCSPELFRYGFCGASNMVLDWVLYFLVYNFIVGHDLVYFTLLGRQWCLTPHIASLCIVFPITLFTGFWLNRHVTFTQSSLHGVRQFVRYITIVSLNLVINYFGLKLFVDICGIYPTPSKMIVTTITVIVSYFGQKYFSFRK